MRTGALVVLACLSMVGAAWANHDTDCTISGGTNGPGQLDCRLPDFVTPQGSQTVLTSKFVYTPSTDLDPPTCTVGTLTVDPVDGFLSIDTTVIDAGPPDFLQEVIVSVDPDGLAPGTYDGSVKIMLTLGAAAPQCPSVSALTGTVAVRLVVLPPAAAPTLTSTAIAVLAVSLGFLGIARLRRRSH